MPQETSGLRVSLMLDYPLAWFYMWSLYLSMGLSDQNLAAVRKERGIVHNRDPRAEYFYGAPGKFLELSDSDRSSSKALRAVVVLHTPLAFVGTGKRYRGPKVGARRDDVQRGHRCRIGRHDGPGWRSRGARFVWGGNVFGR